MRYFIALTLVSNACVWVTFWLVAVGDHSLAFSTRLTIGVFACMSAIATIGYLVQTYGPRQKQENKDG